MAEDHQTLLNLWPASIAANPTSARSRRYLCCTYFVTGQHISVLCYDYRRKTTCASPLKPILSLAPSLSSFSIYSIPLRGLLLLYCHDF